MDIKENMKNLIEQLKIYVAGKEPIVVVSTVAAAITAFVTEAQGGLHGQAAWYAVAWAAVTWLLRHLASPAVKTELAAEAVQQVESQAADVIKDVATAMPSSDLKNNGIQSLRQPTPAERKWTRKYGTRLRPHRPIKRIP